MKPELPLQVCFNGVKRDNLSTFFVQDSYFGNKSLTFYDILFKWAMSRGFLSFLVKVLGNILLSNFAHTWNALRTVG